METNKEESKKITLSVIKEDIGGWVGHSAIHPALIESATEQLATAKTSGMLVDYHVTACGDDLQLIMTHRHGVDCEAIHRLAWETFEAGTQVAKDLHLLWSGAGSPLRCLQRQCQRPRTRRGRNGNHRTEIRAGLDLYGGQNFSRRLESSSL